MEKNNSFSIEKVQVRLAPEALIYSDEKIDSPTRAVEAVGREISDFDREVVAVINLKSDGTPINCSFVSLGALDKTLSEPREMLKSTILSNASSIILMHNHPSGNILPSRQDISITGRMNQICKLMGLNFLDHIIVSPQGDFYSFNEHNMLEVSDDLFNQFKMVSEPMNYNEKRGNRNMIEYKMFKMIVDEKIMAYMPEGSVLRSFRSDKVNGPKDAFSIAFDDNKNICPTMYYENLYKEYLETEDLRGVIEKAAETYKSAVNNVPKFDLDPKKIYSDVTLQLVNRESNEELLSKVPHRPFADMELIYRWVLSKEASIIVTSSLMERYGIDEEKLYAAAFENDKSRVTIKDMGEVMSGLLGGTDSPVSEYPFMYVISKGDGKFGASAVIYSDKLQEFADKINHDLIILPSSIHEVIAIPKDKADDLNYLVEVVEDVNSEVVDKDERLSNNVYTYSRDTRELTVLKESSMKRVDGLLEVNDMQMPEKIRR